MPAVKAGAPAAGEVVVRIDQLEEWAQLAFEGYKCAPVPQSQGVKQPGVVARYSWPTKRGCVQGSTALKVKLLSSVLGSSLFFLR